MNKNSWSLLKIHVFFLSDLYCVQNMDPFKVDKTPEILRIAPAKRKKLRLSPQNTGVLYPQPKPKISRRIGTPDGVIHSLNPKFQEELAPQMEVQNT